MVAASTKMVDEDRGVEDDKINHRVQRILAFPNISTSASGSASGQQFRAAPCVPPRFAILPLTLWLLRPPDAYPA
jgi:hypothetical protein